MFHCIFLAHLDFLDTMATMAQPSDGVIEPIPISLISGRYLLFDIDTVTHLRRAQNICGVLMGTIPQIPQQNVFLGLPVELLPEEAKLLVEKEVAYIVDDARWHRDKFRAMAAGTESAAADDRKAYLASLRAQGRKARVAAEVIQAKRAEKGLAKQAILRASKEKKQKESKDITSEEPATTAPTESSGVNATASEPQDESLFESHPPPRSASPSPSIASSMISSSTNSKSDVPYTLTPTTTYGSLPALSLPSYSPDAQQVPVPPSYPLFKHLQQKSYFLTPGLRFGCDYTVYPGDPLRFHSHFLAVGYEWEQEVPLIDLIGGGRLGTGVKKGYLVGGEVTSGGMEEMKRVLAGEDMVRTFCIEWGGM